MHWSPKRRRRAGRRASDAAAAFRGAAVRAAHHGVASPPPPPPTRWRTSGSRVPKRATARAVAAAASMPRDERCGRRATIISNVVLASVSSHTQPLPARPRPRPQSLPPPPPPPPPACRSRRRYSRLPCRAQAQRVTHEAWSHSPDLTLTTSSSIGILRGSLSSVHLTPCSAYSFGCIVRERPCNSASRTLWS